MRECEELPRVEINEEMQGEQPRFENEKDVPEVMNRVIKDKNIFPPLFTELMHMMMP